MAASFELRTPSRQRLWLFPIAVGCSRLEARSSQLVYGNLCANPGTVLTMSLKITITAKSTMKTNAAW